MWVRIEDILFPPAVPAGMNPYVLMSLAYAMRTSAEWPCEPVEVQPVGALFRLSEGRHRVVAAMMAGRRDVWCVEDKDGHAQSTEAPGPQAGQPSS